MGQVVGRVETYVIRSCEEKMLQYVVSPDFNLLNELVDRTHLVQKFRSNTHNHT